MNFRLDSTLEIIEHPVKKGGAVVFKIEPHVRLHEWVAEELGLFSEEGLDYQLQKNGFASGSAIQFDLANSNHSLKSGALEDMGSGRASDVSCACHWAVNAAASAKMGKMYAKAYSVCPSAIYVPNASKIIGPEDLARVPVGVGYHSGSHYSAVQALAPFMDRKDIKLDFVGRPFDRTRLLLEDEAQAVNVWGASAYILELLGYRKVVDTTFVMGSFVSSSADPEEVDKYFRALLKAQQYIDIDFQRFLQHWAREIPQDLLDLIDVRKFGPGERIVPQQYTREMYDTTQRWMQTWENLLDEKLADMSIYEEVVLI